MLCLELLGLDVVFNNILVPEDSELLLDGGFLFAGNVQLMEGGVNVLHHLEKVKGETDVQARRTNELGDGFFKQLFVVVRNEDGLVMQFLCWGQIGLLGAVIELFEVTANALLLLALF